MSAHPTRIEWPAMAADYGSPLLPGERVIESIARQEALRALRAFSDLHEHIQNRRLAAASGSDRDWFETEGFMLDGVLQLVCDRVHAITHADGIVVGLAEGLTANGSTTERSKTERSKTDGREIVCRAAAGPLAILRGISFVGESEFLRECLETGRILRCDDCDNDPRVTLDAARELNARSTVVIPLRGRRQQLGVLQVFSRTPWAFTDHDIRCFDLFAELVLSALKPEDQDRRIHWLSDVADDLLRVKPEAAVETVLATSAAYMARLDSPGALPVPEMAMLSQPAIEIAAMIDLSEPAVAELGVADDAFGDQSHEIAETTLAETTLAEITLADSRIAETTPAEPLPSLSSSFLHPPSLSRNSHPGLNVVMGLVAVAALFSAGVWWGMQIHGKPATTKVAPATLATTNTAPQSPAATNAPASSANAHSTSVSDNLMNPSPLAFDAVPLTAVSEDKLAALPKVTGVRHWSSSMGSTVAIDMEDQVPYEVHRLMSPERIYFDLHDTALAAELAGKTVDIGDPSLTRVRIAQPVAGVTRIVLDTKDGSNFSVSMESSPYRLVVELRGSEKPLAASRFAPTGSTAKLTTISANAVPAAAKAAPVAALAAKASDQLLPVRTFPTRTGKFRIVLDAGHGGWDLGTVGREGLLEKDLVLDVTQRLGKLLQARLGSEVMFTRTDDTYLPLEQRADVANQAQADLFVSVHANYSTSAAARGVETYYTNLFSAPGSREVEKHDDGTFAKLTPVSLSSGGLHEKIEESRRLAANVQRSLYSTLAANSPGIRDRGIKDSAFVVLTGTTMPAILTEISFVSSPADEHNLRSETYRQQIAEALYKGIASYEQSSPHAKIAQLQKPSTR